MTDEKLRITLRLSRLWLAAFRVACVLRLWRVQMWLSRHPRFRIV